MDALHTTDRQTAGEGLAGESSSVKVAFYGLTFLALYQFVHFHLEGLKSYLDLGKYVAGTERMPFQARFLPMLFLRLLFKLHVPGMNSKHFLPGFSVVPLNYLLMLDLPCILIAFAFCVMLYRKVSPGSPWYFLVVPIMLYAACWSYLIHVGYDLYYPYDMASLAFFTAGLYCIYTRRFLPLALIMLVGTTNRETTMFLIPIFLLDHLAPVDLRKIKDLPWRRVPWVQLLVLVVIWAGVKFSSDHLFPANDRTETALRLRSNIRVFKPTWWPQAFSGCGFLLPAMLVLRRRVPNPRISAYLLVIPFWFFVMCFYGLLLETRIYGELCPLVAVACVLMIENGRRATAPVVS